MGCMLRSDEMTYCEMYMQPEAAFEIISKLGEKGCVQFEDMTPELTPPQRHYISEFCRCAEMEQLLETVEHEMIKDKMYIPQMKEEPPALQPTEMTDFESMLEKWGEDIAEMTAYQTKLLQSQLNLAEMYYVFKHVDPILGDVEIRRESILARATQGMGEHASGGKLHVHTGVVRRNKCFAFETMLWRVSRGNIYFKTASEDELFEDPQSGQMVRKVAFVAVCQGDQLQSVMEKICTGFHAHMYQCPRTYAERKEVIKKLESRISDLNQVIRKSKYHRCKQLRLIGRKYEQWMVKVKKAKAIYFYMNHFSMDITRKCLIGQGWMPTADMEATHEIFKTSSSKSGSKVESFLTKVDSIETPPTFNRTNKFTRGFQNLINAYGDSKYRELNPGLYTIITFPFLFAVMFGDCGHGFIMFLFALWMVLKEKKFIAQRSSNEIWNIFFGGRYIILLMGVFSIYTGFLYNDVFSKPMRLKENYWINQYKANDIMGNQLLAFDPASKTKSHYIIGVDPVWIMSSNKIRNENSLKMKMSVILGIIQMLFGLILSLFNHIYFRHYYAIILEFLPQLLFLLCMFVWLCFLIFFKWYTYGPKKTDILKQPGCAPFILILFIDMCLMRETKVEPDSPCEPYMFDGQQLIQQILVIVALLNVPILLFGAPVYLLITNKKKLVKARENLDNYLQTRKTLKPDVVDKMEECLHQKVVHYSEPFSDLMINQGVHTIEYVLSTVSHTASYLRLWALSLAHAQLSEMLWSMIFSKLALQDHTLYVGAAKIVVVFGIWAFFSVSILVLMEGLSAFLHTLRLHWVEFMSKFFIGSGTIFRPFTFSSIISGEDKEGKTMEAACKKKKKTKY